jgi:hypothetical protein
VLLWIRLKRRSARRAAAEHSQRSEQSQQCQESEQSRESEQSELSQGSAMATPRVDSAHSHNNRRAAASDDK